MNFVIETIMKRQSVRLFEPKPIPRDILNTIIDAGNKAPFMSEKRYPPWRFVVVEDQEFREKLVKVAEPMQSKMVEGMKEHMPEMYEMAMRVYDARPEPKDMIYYNAPAIVFVIAPARNSVCSALACQNIITAAGSLGIGSCYVGFGAMVKGDPDVIKALELTENEQIYGPILLGYPMVNPSEKMVSMRDELRPKHQDPIIKWI